MYNNNLLGSKKFKAALVGALSAGITEFVIVFGAGMGIDIPQELVLMVLAPFLTYIGAKGAADIAYNAKNGKTVETPSLDKNLIGGFETPLKPAYEPPQDYDYAGRMSDAKTEYQKALWADYTLIDLYNPAQVERDFLAKWEKQYEAARNLWWVVKGTQPPTDPEDSCRTGDWSFEARALVHSARDLQIQKDFIAAIKKNKALSYQLGGLGYLLNGVPWESIPPWAQENLYYHTVEGRKQAEFTI